MYNILLNLKKTMNFELHRTDGKDKILDKIEQPKNPIITEDPNWAKEIRNYNITGRIDGATINKALEGIEFRTMSSPGKQVGHKFDYPGGEDKLIEMYEEQLSTLEPELQRDAQAVLANRQYSEKHTQSGMILEGAISNNPDVVAPDWVRNAIGEAYSRGIIFRNIPAINNWLREMAERNQQNKFKDL
jgi:hypothetical protein